MKKIFMAIVLCLICAMSFAQFKFEENQQDNYRLICNFSGGSLCGGYLYFNHTDSTFVCSLYGTYYLYDLGIDKLAPTYTFKLVFKSKQEVLDFFATIKDIYDNYKKYERQEITFLNNGIIYTIKPPLNKMFCPSITLYDVVWLNGRHVDNKAGYVIGYFQSPFYIKKLIKHCQIVQRTLMLTM